MGYAPLMECLVGSTPMLVLVLVLDGRCNCAQAFLADLYHVHAMFNRSLF